MSTTSISGFDVIAATTMADEQKADLRVGYQVACAAWSYESATLWTKFNSFLLANSVTSVGASIVPGGPGGWLVAIVGLVLCYSWYFIMSRGFSQADYWMSSMKELEEKIADVQTMERGDEFSVGREVATRTKKDGFFHRMSPAGEVFRVRGVCNFVICVFGAWYVLAGLCSVVQAWECFCKTPPR